MKRIMWALAMIPVIVTSILFQFLPDRIPTHYDIKGNVDGWGNRAQSFVLPAIILVITLFWHLMILHYEKRAVKAATEKEQMGARSNVKVLKIVGIAETVLFGVLHFVNLYSSWSLANKGGDMATINTAKVSCIVSGILFIVLGNYMTKAKTNSTVGVRTSWSKYNDNTWRKSNRVGAIAIIIAGLLTIITTVFVDATWCTPLMLTYLVAAAIVAVVYSKIAYKKEIEA